MADEGGNAEIPTMCGADSPSLAVFRNPYLDSHGETARLGVQTCVQHDADCNKQDTVVVCVVEVSQRGDAGDATA